MAEETARPIENPYYIFLKKVEDMGGDIPNSLGLLYEAVNELNTYPIVRCGYLEIGDDISFITDKGREYLRAMEEKARGPVQ